MHDLIVALLLEPLRLAVGRLWPPRVAVVNHRLHLCVCVCAEMWMDGLSAVRVRCDVFCVLHTYISQVGQVLLLLLVAHSRLADAVRRPQRARLLGQRHGTLTTGEQVECAHARERARMVSDEVWWAVGRGALARVGRWAGKGEVEVVA